MNEECIARELHFLNVKVESIHQSVQSLHEKANTMSKTQADVQAALDDLSITTSSSLGDIATEVTALQAKITALQGQVSPDLSPLLTSIAAIKAKISAADPGAPAAPAA